MKRRLNKETVIKDVAAAAIEAASDMHSTLITAGDLEVNLPELKFQFWERLKPCMVTCPAFGDFYIKVFIDRRGRPVDADVYVFCGDEDEEA